MPLVCPDVIYILDLTTNTWTNASMELTGNFPRYQHSGTITMNMLYL